MWLVLFVCLVLAFGGLPQWGYHSMGYGPSSLLTVILVVVLVLLLMGRL